MTVNKVILIGNLGADPEMRHTSSGGSLTKLRLATTERRKNPEGTWEEHTEWHSVVCFGKTAENCSRFLRKGRKVYVEGRLRTSKWDGKDGITRQTTEVVSDTVQFLDKAESSPSTAWSVQKSDKPPAKSEFTSSNSDWDDDIPF